MRKRLRKSVTIINLERVKTTCQYPPSLFCTFSLSFLWAGMHMWFILSPVNRSQNIFPKRLCDLSKSYTFSLIGIAWGAWASGSSFLCPSKRKTVWCHLKLFDFFLEKQSMSGKLKYCAIRSVFLSCVAQYIKLALHAPLHIRLWQLNDRYCELSLIAGISVV